jgi:hypothetical protein
MLFLVLVTSTKHYWVISAERRRVTELGGVQPFLHRHFVALHTIKQRSSAVVPYEISGRNPQPKRLQEVEIAPVQAKERRTF